MTKKALTNKADINNTAREFSSHVNAIASANPHLLVYNADQSGFNLEMVTGRTLSFKGMFYAITKLQTLSVG